MNDRDEKILNCSAFEEHLTDYLDKALDSETHKACAAHALRCPLCHGLLNEIKEAGCRPESRLQDAADPARGPHPNRQCQTAMSAEFANYLTILVDSPG